MQENNNNNTQEKMIAEFKNSIANLSLEELKEKQMDIRDSISKMILDSDLIIKAALVEALINEKEGK